MTANHFSRKPLSNLELAEFCSQMSMMLRSGISPLEALNLLREDAQSPEEHALLTAMITEMEQIGFFYQAVSSVEVFPVYTFQMIKLGEETGTLDEIMSGLSEHYTREANLAGMIRGSLVFPCMMLGMMALIIGVLLVRVLPIFSQVFAQLGLELTGFSGGLLTLGEALSRYAVGFLALAALLIFLVIKSRKRLPFYRHIQKEMAACRFADGMSVALKSGMTPEQGLLLTKDLIEDSDFQKKLDTCQEKLAEGVDFSAALRECDIFTGAYARMASLAGKAGTLDAAMAQISAEYEYDVNTKINRRIAAIEPTLVIVLSLIVGIVLFSVMLPLLGIMTEL